MHTDPLKCQAAVLIFMQIIVHHCTDSKSSIDLIYIILYDVNVGRKIGSTLHVSNLLALGLYLGNTLKFKKSSVHNKSPQPNIPGLFPFRVSCQIKQAAWN